MPQAGKTLSSPAASTGGAIFGGAFAKILLRLIKIKWPGFLDDEVADDIDILVVGAFTAVPGFVTHYLVHKGDAAASPAPQQSGSLQ